MKRRWNIRSVALLLVVACTAMWGRSFYSFTEINYFTQYRGIYVISLRGKLYVSNSWSQRPLFNGTSSLLEDNPVASSPNLWPGFPTPDYQCLGFGYFAHEYMDGPSDKLGEAIFIVPYWFVDSFVILIGLYVWKKTRTPDPAKSFPVEIK